MLKITTRLISLLWTANLFFTVYCQFFISYVFDIMELEEATEYDGGYDKKSSVIR